MEQPLDMDLNESMDVMFELIKENPQNTDTDDQLRLRLVASNLRALANVVLIADSKPNEFSLNLKQVALGILGTSDWIYDHIPELED